MYNLETEEIALDNKVEKIGSYQVWWQVPFKGLFDDREKAIVACRELDLDPAQCLVPVPVGVSETLYEILIK